MGRAPQFSDRHWAQSWPEDDAEDRDHPLVMHYEIDSNWLDPVRHPLRAYDPDLKREPWLGDAHRP